ncbi:MAG: POTRA domain-containing protein [Polyangiaceae bacterium]
MRVLALVLAASIGMTPASARAQAAQPPAVVIPIPPATPLAPPPQAPVLGASSGLGGLANRPVVRVLVVLDGNLWDDVEIPRVTSLKPGDPLTPAAARRALREVLDTGRFVRGRASAQPEGQGVLLVLHVVPRKLIGRLDLDLHGAEVDRDDLLRVANLEEGGELVTTDIAQASRRIEQVLALHGYPFAKVRIETRDTDDPTRALVLIDAEPGTPRVIVERRFDVAGPDLEPPLSIAQSTYALSAGSRADEPSLDRADADLEEALREKGWNRAKVSHTLLWVGRPPSGGRVVLQVHVESGSLVLPRFEGNEHYDADALTSALGLATESDRTASHLADRIRAFYEKRGYLDAQVTVELRGQAGDRVRLMVFHVDEQSRVHVAARRYPCLRAEAIKNLSQGGPRSARAIGTEIDSYLDEELPGADLLVNPNPNGVSETIGGASSRVAVPTDLRPDATYVPDTYERAAAHVQELYRNEGFLHAEVGPVEVLRAACSPRSPPGECIVAKAPPTPEDVCAYDPSGLPAPSEPLDASRSCRSDPARGVFCAPTLSLVIPVKLGPRTRLWDIAFTGVNAVAERDAANAADVALGEPVSNTKLEAARRRIADWYKELGYYYVDVKFAIEPSADNTRARVRFDVTEGDRVIVRAIVIRGLTRTRESVVRRRIAIEVGQPYRASDVRRTQENIATLGVFSSVTVGLSEQYVPQANKEVIIDLAERPGHYVELSPGFSTGEGIRGTLEYDERNISGYAIGAVFRTQLSYLPDFLILDPQVETNYQQVQDRLARRITLSGTFPDIGLGPLVRSQLDAIYVRDLERDFTLDKVSGSGSVFYRPAPGVYVAIGQSVEDNDVRLFQFNSVEAYLACNPTANGSFDSALASLLRVPDGESLVVAQRLSVAWDRRDSAFNAHEGTYVAVGAELVNSFPEGTPVIPNVGSLEQCANPDAAAIKPAPQATAHFVRLTQTLAGYIPIARNVSFAAELRLGENVRTAECKIEDADPNSSPPAYCTYPDRLFFMGGFDSMRGWLQDTFMPQEYADQIAQKPSLCLVSSTDCLIPLRGGSLMINPRFELRFPVWRPLDGALFADFGNLYLDPSYVFEHPLSLRADIGAGLRFETPVGPIVLDYGINVTRRPYEDFGAFHFAIGLF